MHCVDAGLPCFSGNIWLKQSCSAGAGVHLNRSRANDSCKLRKPGGVMPQYEADDPPAKRFSGELNDPQQKRLRITCHYIDKLLSDIEHILHQATSQSPFPRYVVDVAPAQVRVVEDYVRRLRRQLLRALDWQH